LFLPSASKLTSGPSVDVMLTPLPRRSIAIISGDSSRLSRF